MTSSPVPSADPGLLDALARVVGPRRLHHGGAAGRGDPDWAESDWAESDWAESDWAESDWAHDEALDLPASAPAAVVEPVSAGEVADVLRVAAARGVPVTARGNGTGLSGAASPAAAGSCSRSSA